MIQKHVLTFLLAFSVLVTGLKSYNSYNTMYQQNICFFCVITKEIIMGIIGVELGDTTMALWKTRKNCELLFYMTRRSNIISHFSNGPSALVMYFWLM